MKINPLSSADFYKVSHRAQYPAGTTLVYSNFTPRSDRLAKKGIMYDGNVVFFGLQYFIKSFLMETFDREFFHKPKEEVLAKYKRRLDNALGKDCVPLDHIEALHKLGYLPLEIRALPEGALVPIKCPVLTIHNTHPEFFWLTNYLESVMSCMLWQPTTSATTARQYRLLLDKYAEVTGADKGFVNFQAHDFSFRGMAGIESAALSGAGHLLFFNGTDTIPAIDLLEDYYGADSDKELIGCSVPATEHSVVSLGGIEDEIGTFRRLIVEVYPAGIVSLVSDTWSLWKVLDEYAPALKTEIEARDGRVVFRPDCYDDITQILTPNGWKYFKELAPSDLVAQVLEDGTHEFVLPLKYIEQDYSGPMYHFYDFHGKLDLLVTPNHRMIFSRAGQIKVQEARKAPKEGHHRKNLVRTAAAQNKDKQLTSLERLKIAFQADGSYCTKNISKIRFSFSKERKIDHLLSIANELNLEINIYDLKDGRKEIHLGIKADIFKKDFSWINISDLCSGWANAFLDELSHWDSSIRNIGRFKFDTTIKEVMDVVELVVIAAGRGILISHSRDDRKPHFSDVYTAHIVTNNQIDGQSQFKKKVEYSGKVYCVQVPSGMLLVKRNRCTLISGNSGNPADIICGCFGDGRILTREVKTAPEDLGALNILWKHFGGTVNDKGYKVLNPKVGLIYGDSITLERAEEILSRMEVMGFCSSNIVLGVGSFTYQHVTRDSYGFAMKATYGTVNGEGRNIYKDPITDSGTKKSAKGLLCVKKSESGYIVFDEVTTMDQPSELKTVFKDGKLLKEWSLAEIRGLTTGK